MWGGGGRGSERREGETIKIYNNIFIILEDWSKIVKRNKFYSILSGAMTPPRIGGYLKGENSTKQL